MLNVIIVTYNKIIPIKNRFEWYNCTEKILKDLKFNNSINCFKA